MKLNETKMARLYSVSDRFDEDGRYNLVPFEPAEFNEEFAFDDLEDELDNLRDHLFDRGEWYQIGDDLIDGSGKVCIQLDGDEIRFDDIRNAIDCDGNAKYFVLVAENCNEFEWVICEPQRTIYSD